MFIASISFSHAGTCWGTYPVMKYCSLPEFRCGVGMHPSHPLIFGEAMLGEDEGKALEDAKYAKMLFMPAKEDLPSVQKGGLAEKVQTD